MENFTRSIMVRAGLPFLQVLQVSPPLELWRALLQKRLRAFLLVFCPGAKSEERGFQRLSLGLAGFQSFVHRLQRVLNAERGVGENLFEDCFRARDHFGGRNDFVHQSDPIGILRADDLSCENDLQSAALPDEPGQALRTAAAGEEPELDFRLAKFRIL